MKKLKKFFLLIKMIYHGLKLSHRLKKLELVNQRQKNLKLKKTIENAEKKKGSALEAEDFDKILKNNYAERDTGTQPTRMPRMRGSDDAKV